MSKLFLKMSAVVLLLFAFSADVIIPQTVNNVPTATPLESDISIYEKIDGMDFETAYEYVSKKLAECPDNYELYIIRSELLYDADKLADAIEDLNSALMAFDRINFASMADPDLATEKAIIVQKRGHFYFDLKNFGQAVIDFEAAIALNDDLESALADRLEMARMNGEEISDLEDPELENIELEKPKTATVQMEFYLEEEHRVGVPECDEYITKWRACVKDKVPAEMQESFESSFNSMTKAWKEAAYTEAGRTALAAGCKQALDTAKLSFASFNCIW